MTSSAQTENLVVEAVKTLRRKYYDCLTAESLAKKLSKIAAKERLRSYLMDAMMAGRHWREFEGFARELKSSALYHIPVINGDRAEERKDRIRGLGKRRRRFLITKPSIDDFNLNARVRSLVATEDMTTDQLNVHTGHNAENLPTPCSTKFRDGSGRILADRLN